MLASLLLLCDFEGYHAAVVARAGAIKPLLALVRGGSGDGGPPMAAVGLGLQQAQAGGSSGGGSSLREFAAAVVCCLARYQDIQVRWGVAGGVPDG